MTEISWSGLLWDVRTGSGLPGQNNWSDSPDNVFVDTDGNLHLRIVKNITDGKWYCAELDSVMMMRYGTYIFNVVSNPANLSDNIVVGMFYYLSDTDEIDIEFSRWDVPGTPNTQYTVWTTLTPPNYVSPSGETDTTNTTHSFIWSPTSIFFESYGILSWLYNDSYIPKLGGSLGLNLWITGDLGMPNNELTQEIVLSSVTVTPTPPVTCSFTYSQ